MTSDYITTYATQIYIWKYERKIFNFIHPTVFICNRFRFVAHMCEVSPFFGFLNINLNRVIIKSDNFIGQPAVRFLMNRIVILRKEFTCRFEHLNTIMSCNKIQEYCGNELKKKCVSTSVTSFLIDPILPYDLHQINELAWVNLVNIVFCFVCHICTTSWWHRKRILHCWLRACLTLK